MQFVHISAAVDKIVSCHGTPRGLPADTGHWRGPGTPRGPGTLRGPRQQLGLICIIISFVCVSVVSLAAITLPANNESSRK